MSWESFGRGKKDGTSPYAHRGDKRIACPDSYGGNKAGREVRGEEMWQELLSYTRLHPSAKQAMLAPEGLVKDVPFISKARRSC
jgi:hypothetical protein